jgi:hypothetical protein
MTYASLCKILEDCSYLKEHGRHIDVIDKLWKFVVEIEQRYKEEVIGKSISIVNVLSNIDLNQ